MAKSNTKTETLLLTRAVGGGNWCAHREECSEHSEGIALAVARGELQSQLVNTDGLSRIATGGEYVDLQASCMLEE